MVTLHSLITSTAQVYAQGRYPLPDGLKKIGSFFEDVYVLWDAYEEYQWTKNNGNGNHIVYAGALHLGSKVFPSLRTPIVILIIVQCVKNIVEQHIKLYEALQICKEVIFSQYPRMHMWKRRKTPSNNRISMGASAQLWINVHIIRRGRQLLKLLRCAWRVLKELATLSKYYVDAYKLITLDTRAEIHALAGVAANCKQYFDHLKDDKNFLMQAIKTNAAIVDEVLVLLGLQEKTSQWMASVAKEIELVSDVTEGTVPIIMQLAQDTIRPLYIEGKVTGYHFDIIPPKEFLDPYSELPFIKDLIYRPQGRFPAWRGKQIKIGISKKKGFPPLTKQVITTDKLKKSLMGKIAEKIIGLFV